MKTKTKKKIDKKQRRRNKAYFFSSFFVTLAAAAFIAGMVSVDINTKSVGWNNKKASFAFSASNSAISMTVMGKTLNIPSKVLSDTGYCIGRIKKGMDCLNPPPLTLADKLYYRYRPTILKYLQKLYDYAGNI